MNVEEILSKAINCLMDRRLSNAIEVLEQLYVQRPSLMGHSEFEAIKLIISDGRLYGKGLLR